MIYCERSFEATWDSRPYCTSIATFISSEIDAIRVLLTSKARLVVWA